VPCIPSTMRCADDDGADAGTAIETCTSEGQWAGPVVCPVAAPACGHVNDAGTCVCPGTVCDGVCVDLQTDVNDCGRCGATCGGSCAGGRCLTTLASGQGEPYAIAVDANNVYWTSGGDGTVMKLAK